ncbi:hypothetical protein HAX54_013085 [Datura stramonium]|uniref:Uncharacterized protein n=1 Tax=Datura stramonium TaxID=4076 RepID=A0ABS8RYM9_DATST|nr:hypothetical protein [Datura stramonium]
MAESEEEENKGPKQFFLQKFDVGSSTIAFATGEVEEAKLEGRPVTNTVIMHNGEEVDLEALLQKEKRPEPELEQSVPLDDPYCNCSPLSCGFNNLILVPPIGAVEEYSAHYVPYWLHYRQLRQTHLAYSFLLACEQCFDIDVHPGPSFGSAISPYDFNQDAELMMELANLAIQQYNEKDLKLTLGTPIDTFQIHAGKSCLDVNAKVIYCCRPKGVGLANCDICFSKLRGGRVKEEKKGS